MIRICRSNSGFERREAARDFVRSFSPGTELLLIGATREAVDDLVQQIVLETGATFGLQRFSFMQLASFLAASELASAGRAPATALGTQAVAARAAFLAQQQAQIQRFTRVSHFPGFAPTLAATLNDLRLAGIETAALAEQTGGDHDLPVLLRLFGEELEKASIADRSTMLRLAARGLGKPHVGTLRSMPVLLLDLPIESKLERDLLRAVCEPAPAVLATVPAADRQTLEALEQIAPGEVVEPVAAAAGAVVKAPVSESTSLTRLRTFLFSDQAPEAGETDERVRFFSAPGEGRECVEIARLILNEARRGIAFDHMAVFLRAPDAYSALLDTAFRRAGVPSYFARGTKRPDPSGRAFLALLACRSERLSAKRFAEYLSFGQVPLPEDGGAPPRNRQVWSGPDDETLGAAGSPASLRAKGVEAGERSTPQQLMLWETDDDGSAGQQRKHDSSTTAEDDQPGQLQKHVSAKTATDAAEHTTTDSDEHPTLAGTLRAPWKWEELLVEAAVIGGKERWGRRLAGLEQELRLKCEAIAGEEPESPRLVALQRDITNLGHLARFAVPIIDALDAAPQSATWAEWVRVLSELAPMVLRRPERVLSVLAELQPMASVGPVSIDEVREVLSDRLSMLEQEPPEQRWGRLFVATPDQARGRTFKVVFVPGLAERVFPQRPREDPLLLDALRRQLSSELRTQEDRGHNERMLLRLALGAAEERVVLSYPRLAAVEARPRVPSFYALDVARAVRGSIPDYEQLEREAAERVQARLAWPAPPDPHDAIDAVEHDLAVLGRFLHVATASAGKGRARYLLELNAHLARSLRTRWLRWRDKWYPEDGLVRTTEITRALFDAQRLKARPYSVTALQKFAACPYQFLLSAIHRLEPRREAVALVQMDPLTRGRMFHHVQAETLRSLQRAGALPVTSAALEEAEFVLDATIERIEAAYREELAPAILRVWQDDVDTMRADLRVWLRRMAEQPTSWEPAHFEWTFGLPLEPLGSATPGSGPTAGGAHDTSVDAGTRHPHSVPGRDPSSIPDPATLPDGWMLRGAIDLIEQSPDGKTLRVTDHKTGVDRTIDGLVVGGGETLQPVLYSLAVEAAMQRPVTEGRLYFCTSRGGFNERIIPIGDWSRHYAGRALKIIDRAISKGVLPPAPREYKADGREWYACKYCDFRPVCGPHEGLRAERKKPEMKHLEDLRSLP